MLEERLEVFVFQFTISTKILNLGNLYMKVKSISCIKRSPCHILCIYMHRIYKHKTLTINSIQHLPKQMTHQHAGTLSGKPFSCWVFFIMEEMQNIHWFQIL